MKPSKLRLTLAAIGVGGLIGAGLTQIGIARADGILSPAEQSFADGGGAAAVCQYFTTHGATESSALAMVRAIMSVGGFTADNAVDIVNYSVDTYCHQYWQNLVDIGNAARNGSNGNAVPASQRMI
jgi:hypothetical protein